MEKCYIYTITNNLDGRQYCGYHITSNPNDVYFGSGTYLKRSIKEHGKENFTKEIVEFSDREHILEKEAEWIAKLDCIFPKGYNLTVGGIGSPGRICTEETRDKLRKSREGTTASSETREKMRKSHKGKTISKEAIERWKISHKDFMWSQEVKDKISLAATKRYEDPTKNPMYGKKHSKETCDRLRAVIKEKKICEHCGGEYSLSMLSRWHGQKCKKRAH